MRPQHTASLAAAIGAMVVLMAAAASLQAVREDVAPPPDEGRMLYLRSPDVVKRVVLSYDSLAADVYWMRALQHFGRTKLAPGSKKQYELLYPLLDLTTSLDPRFNIAYRFGAIFLAEPQPNGAGRPDQAVALLEKGLQAQPDRWEFAEDIGFVYYWWTGDYARASEWFGRAAAMPGAPNWMAPLAAVTEAEGGNRSSSRTLWREILAGSTEEWLRTQAEFRLAQLDALDQIDELERRVAAYKDRLGSLPASWDDVGRVGLLRERPLDPSGFPYHLEPTSGRVTLDPESTLNPLPDPQRNGR